MAMMGPNPRMTDVQMALTEYFKLPQGQRNWRVLSTSIAALAKQNTQVIKGVDPCYIPYFAKGGSCLPSTGMINGRLAI